MSLQPRTRLTRHPERQRHERAELYAVLDSGTVAHLAVCRDDGPVVLPLLYARDGDRLLLHGSTGAGALRLAAQARVAVEVTLLDGLVFADNVFDLSANYRSAVIFGCCAALDGNEKLAALHLLVDRLMPGRWAEVGPPSPKEVAATLVLALPLDHASVKSRTGPPLDTESAGVWRGVLPLTVTAGEPLPAAGSEELSLPASVLAAGARLQGGVVQ